MNTIQIFDTKRKLIETINTELNLCDMDNKKMCSRFKINDKYYGLGHTIYDVEKNSYIFELLPSEYFSML